MLTLVLFFTVIYSFFKEIWGVFKDHEVRALFVWILIILFAGTLFYRWVEGWSVLDSFYFCVITLSTVGYGDFSPSTAAGKLFAIVYIFIGLSIFLAFLNLLAKKRVLIFSERTSDQEVLKELEQEIE